MRTIKYFKLNINDHKIYIAKENNTYIFVGSEDKDFDEINNFIKGDDITFTEGVAAEFEDISSQLQLYYDGKLKSFDLPISYNGTELQKSTWEALLNIPYGNLSTYKEIANAIGHPNAVRAVSSAIGKNPLLIIIPCHRVLGSDNKLRGYRGGIPVKERLLKNEKSVHTSSFKN